MTTPEVHATPSPPFCSPKPVVAARHPLFVFFIVFVSGVRNISARPHGNVGGQPRAELRPTGSPSWRSWRGTALRSPPKSRVSDTPPPLDGDLVATVGRATSEKHCAGTPRPHPDLAPTSPGCWRCGREAAAYALPMLRARTSCPAGCACRAVRAPGVKWTAFARIEDGAGLRTAVSMSTSPVRISDEPERTPIAEPLAMRAVRWCARAGAGAHLDNAPGCRR